MRLYALTVEALPGLLIFASGAALLFKIVVLGRFGLNSGDVK